MSIQVAILLLFLSNMLLIWLTVLANKFTWYRLPGSLIFTFLPLLTVFSEQPRFELDFFWWRIAGVIAIVVGIGLMIWSKMSIGNTSELAVSGPYEHVRHPMYLGKVFIYTGWWWAWSAVYAFYFGIFILAMIWIQAYLEEKLVLEKKFGEKYAEYRKEAGMFWIK